ncbi:MAG: precorrin-4 C(11)-methyltransferase [Phormidesmis sp.]
MNSNQPLNTTNFPYSSASLPALRPAVYIVGAGPGDPDLLTVKAQKMLQQTDVLVYANSLVPKQILSAVRPDAEKIATANMTLEDILPLMIERVRAGKSVVRLQSGDPSLYSAIHEQMLRLSEANVPFEVVPGISAFQAAAAKLQVELTIPAVVQSIILTRISGRTQVPATEELASLAAHQASLCLYLSARHVEMAQSKLLAHYPEQTPVAICFRVGWPDEKIKVVPLAQMAQVTRTEDLVRTTLYIISPALADRPSVAAGEAIDKKAVRSRLYSPSHDHLFRPTGRPMATETVIEKQATIPSDTDQLKKEREQGKR